MFLAQIRVCVSPPVFGWRSRKAETKLVTIMMATTYQHHDDLSATSGFNPPLANRVLYFCLVTAKGAGDAAGRRQ